MDTILSLIFTAFNLCWITYEFFWLLAPFEKGKKSLEWYNKFKANPKYEDWDSEMKTTALFKLLGMSYYIWFLAGLMTFQWQIFAVWILWLIVITVPFKIARKINPTLYGFMCLINTIAGLSFGLFVLLNKYHFRISSIFY